MKRDERDRQLIHLGRKKKYIYIYRERERERA